MSKERKKGKERKVTVASASPVISVLLYAEDQGN
jgi:hypothetical protein